MSISIEASKSTNNMEPIVKHEFCVDNDVIYVKEEGIVYKLEHDHDVFDIYEGHPVVDGVERRFSSVKPARLSNYMDIGIGSIKYGSLTTKGIQTLDFKPEKRVVPLKKGGMAAKAASNPRTATGGKRSVTIVDSEEDESDDESYRDEEDEEEKLPRGKQAVSKKNTTVTLSDIDEESACSTDTEEDEGGSDRKGSEDSNTSEATRDSLSIKRPLPTIVDGIEPPGLKRSKTLVSPTEDDDDDIEILNYPSLLTRCGDKDYCNSDDEATRPPFMNLAKPIDFSCEPFPSSPLLGDGE